MDLRPGFPDIVSSAFDPVIGGQFRTGGVRWYNTTNGNMEAVRRSRIWAVSSASSPARNSGRSGIRRAPSI